MDFDFIPKRLRLAMEKEDECGRDWSKMLPELLQFFSNQLPLLDYLACRGVCRNWRSALSNYSNITSFSKEGPWMMFYGLASGNGLCYLYEKSDSSKCCTTHLSLLEGATCIDSKAGWLLCHRENQVFFYDPFRSKAIHLPPYPTSKASYKSCAFTSPPTDPECIVSMVFRLDSSKIELGVCSVGDLKWEVEVLDVNKFEINLLRDVSFSNCKVDRPCCSYDATIFFAETKALLAYDFVKKEVKGQGGVKYICLPNTSFDEMESAYRDDWLSKFGNEGICISICSFRRKAYFTSYGEKRVTAAAANADKKKLREVKAVWIEPNLKN